MKIAPDEEVLDQSVSDFEPDGVSELRKHPFRRGVILLLAAAVAAVAVAAFLYYSDANSDRYEIFCTRETAEGRRGLFFPWGTGAIDDDAHAPLSLPRGVTCAGARYVSLAELDAALATVLLDAAEHRLTQGGPEALAQARRDVEQARHLQGLTAEQRRRTEAMLADMSYHEGREILRQVERDLWQARRKLERAQTLGAGQRLGDLDEWLQFVESETERFRPALGSPRGEEDGQSEGRPEHTLTGPRAPATSQPESPTPPASPEDVFL